MRTVDPDPLDPLRHYEVSCVFSAEHHLTVGARAYSGGHACSLAHAAFNSGSLLLNTPMMPLLQHRLARRSYSDTSFTASRVGHFEVQEGARALLQAQQALRACEALVMAFRIAKHAGCSVADDDLAEAHRLAQAALAARQTMSFVA